MTAQNKRAMVIIASQQHADQLSGALAEGDMLARYYCGAAPRGRLRAIIGRRFVLAPSTRIAHLLLRKLVHNTRRYQRIVYRLYRDYDRRMAHHVRRDDVDAVIAYENGALHLFRAAKALGKLTILDAADCHYRFQQAMGDTFNDAELQASVNAGKEAELELADYLLCCSEFAKGTYVDAGIPADRIYVGCPGADLTNFRADLREPAGDGPLRMLFAGRFTIKKGADVLIEALERLRAAGIPFHLEIAADGIAADPAIVRRFAALSTMLGKQSHQQLPGVMARADLLLVPSRFDAHPMVVAEAMGCGTPVLASEHVGSKRLIEHGVSGFVVKACDVDALYDQLAWCATHPAEVRAMSPAAARAATVADWTHYRAQARENVRAIFARHWGD